MIDKIHRRLMSNGGVYAKWHKQSPLYIIKHWAILIVVAGLATYGLIQSIQNTTKVTVSLIPQISHAQQAPTNRIVWQGKNWYIHGANLPWYNFGCDFGCNSALNKSGGASTNVSTLTTGITQAKNAGMNVVRWWVFPGDAWQITRDANAAPIGINAAVYADFDAALQIANQTDTYYDFVLFSSPTDIPTTWETDSTNRAKLASVLGTLFAHYSNNPRILSWEIYNEPDFNIWDGLIPQQAVVDTATALTQSVHTNSPGTLVTIGNGFIDSLPMFANVGLDYYSPHWYDYMNSGTYCMICNNYSYYANMWGLTKPIAIGEYFTGISTTSPYSSSYRNNYWYNNGYAGDWAWSIFPGQTNDKLAIDFGSSATFAQTHIDLGPVATSNTSPIAHISDSPTNLSFSGISGGVTPSAQNLTVTNTGTSGLTMTVSTDQAWCHVSPSSGSIAAGSNTSLSVYMDSPTNIGAFTCNINVNGNADNSPQRVVASYTVTGLAVTDTTSPTVAITNPTNGSTVPRKKSVSITANAADNIGVSKVEFYVGTNLVCTDTTSPYSCSWRVPNTLNQSYTIQAKASDAAGNNAVSSVTVKSVR